MVRRAPAVVLVSLLAHAVVFSVGLGAASRHDSEASLLGEAASAGISELAAAIARAGKIEGARRRLIDEARADLAAGRLGLGAFILQANAIDAEEEGLDFDQAEAEVRYAERVHALKEALKEGDVAHAVPEVFSDLRYRGEPGGLMGSALLEGSGSCEQIASLVAATVFDAGRTKEIALRFYGRPMDDGIAHVAPIAISADGERDLMSGRPAFPGGSKLAATDLIDIYARAHGLAPPITTAEVKSGAGKTAAQSAGATAKGADAAAKGADAAGDARPGPPPLPGPDRPSLIAGFPPNDDRYPGSMPLYSARAVKDPIDEPTQDDEIDDAKDRARDCAYSVRMAGLNPPLIEVETNAEGMSGVYLEPHRFPKPAQLERKASLLRAAETLAEDATSDAADKVMGWACLAALGDAVAVDFELAGERRFADAALEKHKRGRDEGAKALASIQWSTGDGERTALRLLDAFGGKTWLLLALPGGEDALYQLLQRPARDDDWGRVSSLAALALWPATKERALALIERLPAREQVDVMHEIFHAHDHMRPWATNVDIDDPPSARGAGAVFRRVYGVFRGLAFRLWEGQRGVEEILDALSRESSAAGLDRAWEAALIDYCARNALGLYSQRAVGMEVVRVLHAAVRRSGHPSLATLEKQLDYIESQSTLNARTLADAMRMR